MAKSVVVEKREATKYNGCNIAHLVEVDAKSVTATVDENDKLEFEGGRLAVDLLTDSYKYGSEIQFVYYTRQKPKIRQRVDGHNGWFRTEFHLSFSEAAKLVKELLK